MKMFLIKSISLLAAAVFLTAACGEITPDEPATPDSPVETPGPDSDSDPEPEVYGKLTIDGKFPIVAWTGINADETAKKFGPMKDCGFNVYLGWYDTDDQVISALDDAEDAGVKLIIRSETFLANPATLVNRIKNHPALFMYHIEDEPEVSEFNMLKDIVNKVRAIDTEHPCYINLYPNWVWTNWSVNATAFLDAVPMEFLSFDQYPIMEVNGVSQIRGTWYRNLEDCRKVARAKELPFWAFALTIAHTEETTGTVYPIPTLGELRLQMFSNLAYGCQGFQYWTYWGIYHDAPTSVYNPVQSVNKDLQVLSKIFLGADVKNVWHTGAAIPDGTKELKTMPEGIKSLTTSDKGAVVSSVEKNGKKYLAIVNKDYKNKMTLNIEFTGSAWKYDKNGLKGAASSGKSFIDPGDIVVYQL